MGNHPKKLLDQACTELVEVSAAPPPLPRRLRLPALRPLNLGPRIPH